MMIEYNSFFFREYVYLTETKNTHAQYQYTIYVPAVVVVSLHQTPEIKM